jgi:hypothetical protein
MKKFLPITEDENWKISIPSGLSEYLELIVEKPMLMFLHGAEQGTFQTESIRWTVASAGLHPFGRLFFDGKLCPPK